MDHPEIADKTLGEVAYATYWAELAEVPTSLPFNVLPHRMKEAWDKAAWAALLYRTLQVVAERRCVMRERSQ